MAAVFLYSGQDKARRWSKAVDQVRELQLPAPQALMAASTIIVSWSGGVAAHGLLTGDPANEAFTTFVEHLAIIGGLLLVIVDAFSFRAILRFILKRYYDRSCSRRLRADLRSEVSNPSVKRS